MRRYYISIVRRIPGRRDACTDCVELAASSSESRAASGRSPWWEALNPHGAGPQDYTMSLFFFLSTSLFLLSLSFCLSLSFHLILLLTPSFASLDIIFNLLCIFDTCGPSRRKSGRREYTTATGCRLSFRGKIEWRKIWRTSENGKKKREKERRDMVVEEVRGSDGGDRTESAAFRSRVNCRDIVDRAARPSIKRLGQNVLLFGARPVDERKKERSRLNEPTWRADHYVKDEGMRKKNDGDNDDDDDANDASRDQTGCNRANSCSLVFSLIGHGQVSKRDCNFERL